MPRDLTTASDARLRANARTLAFEIESETRAAGAPTARTLAELARVELELELRAFARSERAIERLADRGHADRAARILRAWDRGDLMTAQALEQARS